MNVVELIRIKRDGGNLAPTQVRNLIAAYTEGTVPDYQMSAFAMAAFLNGLSADEAAALTDAMLHSGQVLDLSDIAGVKVDKHSTGGVGDKISLILAPIVAACGVPVPMISGRGLGHTGGTLDKLESIPGFNTQLSIAQYRSQLRELGIVMIGQTDEIAPADRKLYALRDVTATVEFIPFIAASIMSKKLAEGIDALVLDVKCGSGAFMKTYEDARILAETLVSIGQGAGTPTVAWVTDMNAPLGRTIGNWPEMEESIRCLNGEKNDDLMDLTYTLASEMIVLGKRAESLSSAREMAERVISNGEAWDIFRKMVKAQGGEVSAIDHPRARLKQAETTEISFTGTESCYVGSIDSATLGHATVVLGAGRMNKEDAVDPLAGIVLDVAVGDYIEPGDRLATVLATDKNRTEQISDEVRRAFSYSTSAVKSRSRMINRYTDGLWMHQDGVTSV